MKKIQKIAVIGDGSWGTTLSVYLAKKHYPVFLWGAFEENILAIQKTRYNQKFLPGILLPENIMATVNLSMAVEQAQLVILAVPSQYISSVLTKLKKLDLKDKIFLSVIKGIENKTLLRMSQIIARELGPVPLAVLSGPNISRQIARGVPSTTVVASKNPAIAKTLQGILNSPCFRVYTNTDVPGVELGGSLKNIIAIACGLCDGLGYDTNTKAAILTRGIVEIARFGQALGAKARTFYGLTGLGDLITTSFSPESRNHYFGEQLGKGKSLEEIKSSFTMVAEGVPTTKAVYRLSRNLNIPMPITQEVYHILYKNKQPLKAVSDLMNRKTKSE